MCLQTQSSRVFALVQQSRVMASSSQAAFLMKRTGGPITLKLGLDAPSCIPFIKAVPLLGSYVSISTDVELRNLWQRKEARKPVPVHHMC